MSRFVKPEAVTLQLANGDTLTVKRYLSAGDVHDHDVRLYAAGVDGTPQVNYAEIRWSIVRAYLLDWSLTDDAGQKVPIAHQPDADVLARLRDLHQEDFAEIFAAIRAHADAMQAARAAEKKTDGRAGSAPTLPSPADAAGPTPTSLH
jgi:hypothetical protein